MSTKLERQTREIIACTMYNRSRKAVYLPGALDRAMAYVEQRRAARRVPWTQNQYLNVLTDAIKAEEKSVERDAALFDAMAFPGWREWAVHAEDMV